MSKEKNKINETETLKDYISLIRNNLLPIGLITGACLLVSAFYALNANDIFRSTAVLKVSKPQGSILNSPLMPEFHDFGSDRFIANEIEVIKTFSVREKVAAALLDSFNLLKDKNNFHVIFNQKFNLNGDNKKLLDTETLAKVLQNVVSIEQKRGLDIIEITAESQSPVEAALIANTYANQYRNKNLEVNRNHLTFVKDFLLEQKIEKQNQLNQAEERLRSFQEQGGIIALDEQASSLITQLAQFEARKNATQIELITSDKILKDLKDEMEKQNPRLADYLKGLSSEAYFQSLQEQLVKLEVNRDLTIANTGGAGNNQAIRELDSKIKELQRKLDERIETIKSGVFASSPAEVKELSQRIINEEVKNQSLRIEIKELQAIVGSYESKFNRLPKTAIELARYQRNRESLEKLYTLVEAKFQEAVINEQSQPGNVLIIDNARRPSSPSKPNRLLIVFIGFILGSGLALTFIFIRNYFDNTVKSPEDLLARNINVLAWIPRIDGMTQNGHTEYSQPVISVSPDSTASEAFRALRTRVQFSKLGKDALKTILVTSSAPQEGKTTVAVNLAASFAITNKNTLIIDCDLRKPRVHTIFGVQKTPGLIDHLFNNNSLNEVIRKSSIPNLSYITSGTIPPNPAEMLDSDAMKELVTTLRKMYDVVVFDSPPIIAVTDSEILCSLVDGTVVVVSSDTTDIDLLEKSIELLKTDNSALLGAVLNNFNYKSGYSSYYKYYYYYSSGNESRQKTFDLTNRKN